MSNVSALSQLLEVRQLALGGWSYYRRSQMDVEATSLAVMALNSQSPHTAKSGIDQLLRLQPQDGGWPAFLGDSESSWTTALVLSTLNLTNDFASAREKALRWIILERGREGHWFWRWKFKTVDRNVRFDPDKYGWPWGSGSASWVIPTAFSIIALKQYTVCNRLEASEKRINLGVEMLLDRVCVAGGWNSGNSIVYGMPLRPHVEATAIALLALQGERRSVVIDKSLEWLKLSAGSIEAVSSLAWCILSLFVYQEPVDGLKNRLVTLVGDGRNIHDNATLATAILALKCGEMIHPFVVLL
jgi:hypothetical protein